MLTEIAQIKDEGELRNVIAMAFYALRTRNQLDAVEQICEGQLAMVRYDRKVMEHLESDVGC